MNLTDEHYVKQINSIVWLSSSWDDDMITTDSDKITGFPKIDEINKIIYKEQLYAFLFTDNLWLSKFGVPRDSIDHFSVNFFMQSFKHVTVGQTQVFSNSRKAWGKTVFKHELIWLKFREDCNIKAEVSQMRVQHT